MMSEGRVFPVSIITPDTVNDALQPGESTLHPVQEHIDWCHCRHNGDKEIHHTGITVGTAVTAIMRMFVIRHLVSESPRDHTSRDEPC